MKSLIFPITLLFVFMISGKLFGQTKYIADPLTDFLPRDYDSSYPITVHKIVYDFNSDGLPDIALSSSVSWGNAGGAWSFYFKNTDNSYCYYDKIEILHPEAYSVKKQNSEPNILLVYERANCCSGSLSFYSITSKGFKLVKIKQYGAKGEINSLEQLNKELAKGQKGTWTNADIKCVIMKKKNCWH